MSVGNKNIRCGQPEVNWERGLRHGRRGFAEELLKGEAASVEGADPEECAAQAALVIGFTDLVGVVAQD